MGTIWKDPWLGSTSTMPRLISSLSGFLLLVALMLAPDWHAALKWLPALDAGLVEGRAPFLPFFAAGSMSVVVSECAYGSCAQLAVAPPWGVSVAF